MSRSSYAVLASSALLVALGCGNSDAPKQPTHEGAGGLGASGAEAGRGSAGEAALAGSAGVGAATSGE